MKLQNVESIWHKPYLDNNIVSMSCQRIAKSCILYQVRKGASGTKCMFNRVWKISQVFIIIIRLLRYSQFLNKLLPAGIICIVL